MALVCESSTPVAEEKSEPVDAAPADDNDLEDGEIEDDDEDEVPVEPEKQPESNIAAPATPTPTPNKLHEKEKAERDRGNRHDRDRRRHDDKKKHMTEAEKSILHLRKREKMQREKWMKFRKEQVVEAPEDDFAINIEKAIASVLKKDKHNVSDEEKDEDKRSRKRKNRDKDRSRSAKQRRADSPKIEETDDDLLNMRSGSPKSERKERSDSARSDDSYDSEYSSDRSKSDERRDRRKDYKRNRRNRDRTRKKSREREKKAEPGPQLKDAQGVCVFFLQGKCQKNDCPYSHEAVPPMKLELCKFYLMDCCAKGEKCSYMHSEFPCKFYHTGLPCLQGENCKFAHGKSLSDNLKQILFKHIETAPREILGGFPRMSREEALNMINVTQMNLQVKYGGEKRDISIPSLFDINVPVPSELNDVSLDIKPKNEKSGRSRPSRWQDPDPVDNPLLKQNFSMKPFNYGAQDQDMRINSNGDIDMRTLPPLGPQILNRDSQPEKEPTNFIQDIDIRNPHMLQFDTKDVDIRQDPRFLATKDVDIRQIPVFDNSSRTQHQQEMDNNYDDEEESELQIDTGEGNEENAAFPPDLPKTQRDLFLRIQAQQKTNLPEEEKNEGFDIDTNIDWYSDSDDDENKLTIKVDNEEEKKEENDNSDTIMSPPQIKPQEVVEKLGDLSKIDISAEVTKLLTSMSQSAKEPPKAAAPLLRDPRQLAVSLATDPRQKSQAPEQKLSIYEQGSLDCPRSPDQVVESDIRARPDVDLRNLQLPFKGMMNYTPAKEIDASINSHPPIPWRVQVVDVPRPDYTGLKLSVQDAEKTGDPRLRKIFRLSTEEKDSPASPKASPKATARIDPRLKKIEEKQQEISGILSYNQQLNILQSSAFFQSLTSNQKLLLNQELSSKNDQNGVHNPVLNSLLTSLNLIPSPENPNISNPTMGTALSILANVNKLNPGIMPNNPAPNPMVLGQGPPNIMNQMAQSMVQPGLLGAAPGIPNLPPDFPMNFDPRNGGGLLGNAPGPFGQNYQENYGGNFDDYYPPPQQEGNFGPTRDNRNFNRDRRRGRHNFNRNSGNRNFRNRNNRSNRTHSPP